MLARTVSAVANDLSSYFLYALLQTVATGDKAIADKAQEFAAELNGDMGLALIRQDELEQMRKELIELRKRVADRPASLDDSPIRLQP
jgi:hypothetical protein